MTDTSPEAVERLAQKVEDNAESIDYMLLPDGIADDVSAMLRALAAKLAETEAERDEARRRRDEWKRKAEGCDAMERALREKVGNPWPPHMSRLLWAGLAAAEKRRADAAEAALATAREGALREVLALARYVDEDVGHIIDEDDVLALIAAKP